MGIAEQSDFLIRLTSGQIVVVETKGQVDVDVPQKMARLRQWCEDLNRLQNDIVYDFVYVDQINFDKYRPGSFKSLIEGFRDYKELTVN